MASESFVLVINIHQSCCKSFCWGQPRGLLLCILLPPPVSQSLTKSALVLLCRFNPPSTSSIFLPSGFSLSAFISCVAMALLRRASERRRKRDEKSERNNNKKKECTVRPPSLQCLCGMWGSIYCVIAAEVLEIAACWRQAGDGKAAADQTWRKQWKAGCGDFSTRECHREQKPHCRSGWFYWRSEGLEVLLSVVQLLCV